jgi:YHS domain-containing protein
MATVRNIDPVCGMELTPGQIEAQSQYQGKRYDFCSVECKRLFDANPKAYIDASATAQQDQGTLPR